MKLYIYNQESMEVVAIVNGESNDECERKAEDANYYPSDDIAWTYSPAFGFEGGLVENEEAEEI
jgi:hypothetical protein